MLCKNDWLNHVYICSQYSKHSQSKTDTYTYTVYLYIYITIIHVYAYVYITRNIHVISVCISWTTSVHVRSDWSTMAKKPMLCMMAAHDSLPFFPGNDLGESPSKLVILLFWGEWSKWRFPKIGVSQNGWFVVENPSKIGWFRGTPIYGNPQMEKHITYHCFVYPCGVVLGMISIAEEGFHLPCMSSFLVRHLSHHDDVIVLCHLRCWPHGNYMQLPR